MHVGRLLLGVAMAVVVLLGLGPAATPEAVAVVDGGTYAYDSPAIARVCVQRVDAVEAGATLLSDVREGSASPTSWTTGTSTTPSAGSVATEAGRLSGRVDDFHGALDPIAQNSRTTSVMSTRQGTDIIASGGRDLSPAQRALAQSGDFLGRVPGAHAEVTSLDAATKAGLTPAQIAVSRPICGPCQAVIQGTGGEILPGGMGAIWPR